MFQKQTGITVDVSGDKTSVEVSSDVSLVLFRVAQEALSNVAKHAKTQHVTVAINATADAVTMHISDDGCGFEPDRIVENTNGEHLGVITMYERTRSVGGIIQIDSEFNKGTQITLTVPTTVPDE
jgi:signal transduction histidine kinase